LPAPVLCASLFFYFSFSLFFLLGADASSFGVRWEYNRRMSRHTSSADSRRKLIRNSTAEFLIFTAQDGVGSIEARYEDETVWLTQKLMAELFDVEIDDDAVLPVVLFVVFLVVLRGVRFLAGPLARLSVSSS